MDSTYGAFFTKLIWQAWAEHIFKDKNNTLSTKTKCYIRLFDKDVSQYLISVYYFNYYYTDSYLDKYQHDYTIFNINMS